MNTLFKKLNYKDQKQVLVLDAPACFEQNLQEAHLFCEVLHQIKQIQEINFAIIFVTKQSHIDEIVPKIVEKVVGDVVLWFCYPKASSKNYKCDFNRDTGWKILGENAFEAVRMIAIDADWSALRFRKVNFIKKITRKESFALSQEGKKRTSQKDI